MSETQYQAGIRHAAYLARKKAEKCKSGSVIRANPRAVVLYELARELEREADK